MHDSRSDKATRARTGGFLGRGSRGLWEVWTALRLPSRTSAPRYLMAVLAVALLLVTPLVPATNPITRAHAAPRLPQSLASGNFGTVKIGDGDDPWVLPKDNNEPHVECAFYVVGDDMAAPSGYIRIEGWPPTNGSRPVVLTDTYGATAPHTVRFAVQSAPHKTTYSFTNGLYTLPAGHYKLYVTDINGHTKMKVFWVDPCPTSTPIATNTAVPATVTNTPAPTVTNTPVPATATDTAVPATATNTPPAATVTNTPVPATATNTAVSATATNTAVSATATDTPVPATATSTVPVATVTNTPVPATVTNTPVPATATDTAVPATATNTPPAATVTNTPVPATATNTPVPATATNTPAPTVTNTPVPATATNTPVAATATDTPVPATATSTVPAATVTNTPVPATATSTVPVATVTNTPVPATATNTPPAATATETAVPATETATTNPVPPVLGSEAPPTNTTVPAPATETPVPAAPTNTAMPATATAVVPVATPSGPGQPQVGTTHAPAATRIKKHASKPVVAKVTRHALVAPAHKPAAISPRKVVSGAPSKPVAATPRASLPRTTAKPSQKTPAGKVPAGGQPAALPKLPNTGEGGSAPTDASGSVILLGGLLLALALLVRRQLGALLDRTR